MTDAQGHTIRDERDELIAALRAERDSLSEMLAMGLRPGAIRIARHDTLRQATARAERALAKAPQVRRVEVHIQDVRPIDSTDGVWIELSTVERDDALGWLLGARVAGPAVLLVPVSP